MEKVAITQSDVAAVADSLCGGPAEVKLRPPIALIYRLVILPLVFGLPLLCIFSVLVCIGVRNREPRIQHAWIRYMFGLLVASGLMTTIAAGLIFLMMRPIQVAAHATAEPFALDTMAKFPEFAATTDLSTEELVRKMEPAVMIVSSDMQGTNPSRKRLEEGGFGAGVLLFAKENEYLVATCRHVVDGDNWKKRRSEEGALFVYGREGGFASATVVGRHKSLDLALLRLPRSQGNSRFAQPICSREQIALGGRIVVFGHPQGMFYSVSDGLVSRVEGDTAVQISAPISPGASGGPVYDLKGRLLGIITSSIDKTSYPQAENINFAVRADALLQPQQWEFFKGGSSLLADFEASSKTKSTKPQQETNTSSPTTPNTDNPKPN
jgi:S1-C subfamily serine protease